MDQKKLDSFAQSIDSAAKAFQLAQDSFVKVQDSIYHSEVNNNSQPDDLAEKERKNQKQRQKIILRLVGVGLFIIGVVLFLRRRETKSS